MRIGFGTANSINMYFKTRDNPKSCTILSLNYVYFDYVEPNYTFEINFYTDFNICLKHQLYVKLLTSSIDRAGFYSIKT